MNTTQDKETGSRWPIVEQKAAQQPQHSPLPMQPSERAREWDAKERIRLMEDYERISNNADKLAAAAARVTRDWPINRRKYLASSMAVLRDALAVWEATQ